MVDSSGSVLPRVVALVAVFSCSLLVLWSILDRLPVTSVASGTLSIPRNLDDAKAVINVLTELKDDFYVEVVILMFTSFVWLQTFALPGTIFFVLGSGMLFSFPTAMAVTALASAVGATSCYTVSALFCAPLMERFFSARLAETRVQVQKMDGKFLTYMIFIRATPFLPNWFVNVAAPLIGVPIVPFFFGTLVGVVPPYILFLRVGRKIHDFATLEDAMPWEELVVMWVVVMVVAVPILFKDRIAAKLGIAVTPVEPSTAKED